MIFIEMARNEVHGGDGWEFLNCVWSPTKKQTGGQWPFWNKILNIKKGDIILHLRGVPPHANFVGYSIASSDGFETSNRPPYPEGWNYAETFYRADLSDFTKFHERYNLSDIFSKNRAELEKYFLENKTKNSPKLNLFYVIQSGKLGCLNGAYLSDADEKLIRLLLGSSSNIKNLRHTEQENFVYTDTQITTILSRIGQQKFALEIKKLYNHKCCFPGCQVSDPRFLQAAHIARWSDNVMLRGHLGNGLCFCLVHDKAFEVGIFTIDKNYQIFVNPTELPATNPIIRDIMSHKGQKISLANILPKHSALQDHWKRIRIAPPVLH